MKILIAGGGTAGHINPGIAIAKYLKQKIPDCEIMFVGTQKGLEVNLVPREGFTLKTIRVMGFKRKLSLETLVSVRELFAGVFEARKVIKSFNPDIVIGTGGYVCGPVLFMASVMGIPTLIHEQNAFPGVTNRILARFVNSVAISFKESREYFGNTGKITLTGNPIRSELLDVDKQTARAELGLSSDLPLVVIFGGSRGAERVNEAIVNLLKNNYQDKFEVIFATGESQYEKVKQMFGEFSSDKVKVVPYIYEMAKTLGAADLVVARAGAITVSELAAMGLPSILIPSPYVTANHQESNARALEVQGGAVVLLEKNLNPEILYHQILSLVSDKELLQKMGRNAKKIGVTNASERIYSLIQSLTH